MTWKVTEMIINQFYQATDQLKFVIKLLTSY